MSGEKAMTKRAVLYARVSGDDRGKPGNNLTGQIEMGREYALSRGYTIVAELMEDDRGAKGDSFDLEKLNQALEMARSDQFDVLVVRELDRFARSLVKQLIVEAELKRVGVEIDYVLGEYPDTPEGNLNKNIRAVVAEYERVKIAERTKRARRRAVKDGNVMIHGNPPYGYHEGEKDGKRVLEVYEPEARIVRLVFTWYTEGDGQRGPIGAWGITHKLSKMGIPRPSGDGMRWCKATVAEMLKKKAYIGIWRYGKRGATDLQSLPVVRIPAIISETVWKAAEERRAQAARDSRRRTKYQYLLRRRVWCGQCATKMSSRACKTRRGVNLYYCCAVGAIGPAGTGSHTRTCSQNTHFRVEQVDAAVWDKVRTWIMVPEQLRQQLDAYRAAQNTANEPLRERLDVVDSLLSENRDKLERLLDLYLAGDFPKEMLTERKTRLEETISALESERATLEATLKAQTLTDEQIADILQFTARIQSGIEAADKDFRLRREVIDTLDVTVTLEVENGEKVAWVSCKPLGKEERVSIASSSSTAPGR
jgi:site-specific DNA recombinase